MKGEREALRAEDRFCLFYFFFLFPFVNLCVCTREKMETVAML